MVVRVVSPDIMLSRIKTGKYGPYIEITNPNTYDLDLSFWKISIDGALFSFPKNTLLANGVTRFPGTSLGFASTTVSSSTIIKLLFQNMEEVLRVTQEIEPTVSTTTLQKVATTPKQISPSKVSISNVTLKTKIFPSVASKAASSDISSSTTLHKTTKKDTRLASFLKSLFSH
jgi:hypothetical protein